MAKHIYREMSEEDRLATVRSLGLMDVDVSAHFRSFVTLAKAVSGAMLASISLIDEGRVVFLCHNFVKELDVSQVPRPGAICPFVLHQAEPQIVPRMRADTRFDNNPYVYGPPFFSSWVGIPIIAANGAVLGSLSIADFKPIKLTKRQILGLKILAEQIAFHMIVVSRTLADRFKPMVGLLHQLSNVYGPLSLDDAENFFQLCATDQIAVNLAGPLIESGLVEVAGDVAVLSEQGLLLRTVIGAQSAFTQRKPIRMISRARMDQYFSELSSLDKSA